MKISSMFRRSFTGCFVLGMAAGLIAAFLIFSYHTICKALSYQPLLTANNFEEYRVWTWIRPMTGRSMPPFEIPKSATDIMISDRSAIDMNVYISFRASPHDFNEFVANHTNGDVSIERIEGERKDKYLDSKPLHLGNMYEKYWLDPLKTDYYYYSDSSGGGRYFGVDEKNCRVFYHRWSK